TTCTATVSDTDGPGASAPSGNVTFWTANSGWFTNGGSCILGPLTASSSSCDVGYTPTARDGGIHDIAASYNGDSTHATSAAATFPLGVKLTQDDLILNVPNPGVFGQVYTLTTSGGNGSGAV